MLNKILVLGSTGMLGSRICYELAKDNTIDLIGCLRETNKVKVPWKNYYIKSSPSFVEIDNMIRNIKPNYIINCIGWIRQKNSLLSDGVLINSVLPHQLSEIGNKWSAKIIHFSTDCVYSGSKGNYSETDQAQPYDFYGQSKLLGEPSYDNTLCLRTSIIGYEIQSAYSLFEWFLSQDNNEINGYKNAYFSGLTTNEIAYNIINILKNFNSGLFNWGGPKISKYELLNIIKNKIKYNIKIVPVDNPIIDRSLNSKKFNDIFKYKQISWDEMISAMLRDGRINFND